MLAAEGRPAARQFAEETFAVMAFWLGTLTIAGELLMPHLMGVLAPGFRAIPEKFDLAVALSRITFPYLPIRRFLKKKALFLARLVLLRLNAWQDEDAIVARLEDADAQVRVRAAQISGELGLDRRADATHQAGGKG